MTWKNSKAPIAIFTFKRLKPLIRSLRALEACQDFEASPVFVYSDAARNDQGKAEQQAIAEVRKWLRSWCIQHRAELVEAETNQGLRSSITSGIAATLRDYDRVIVLEDDIIVSRSFLVFMNDSLDSCEENESICQISGYFVPHRRRLPRRVFSLPACWGWATWRRAWQHYRDDAAGLFDEISQGDPNEFDFNGAYHHLASLEDNALGKLDTWMVRWYASLFLRGGLTLYPSQSLTRNIGFDRDGMNCQPGRTARTLSRQRIAQSAPQVDWGCLPLKESPEFLEVQTEFYRWQLNEWTRPNLKDRARARFELIRKSLQRS